MRKLYLSLLSSILFLAVNGQINYTFSASSGTYTAITGTTATLTPTGYDGGSGGLDEGYLRNIPIGFNFTYNGATTPFTTVGVTSNGFLYLGSTDFTNTSTIYTNNLTSGFSAQRPIIAPLWDDLFVGSVEYSLSGSAPNRVFTMQWTDANWNYSGTSPALSFQAKLYETTNVIEFIYNNLGGTVVSGSASIGLTGTTTGAGSFLSLNNSGATPTASSATETTSISSSPATGQIYTFTPVPPIANDISVERVYALGKAGKGTLAYVRAYVKNLGTNPGTNIPVTLTVTGANSHTATVNVASFPSGAAGFVSFPGFLIDNVGANTITVTVPADESAANNSAATTQDVTTNELSYAVGATISGGVNAGAGNQVATKLAVPYGNTVTQINAYFNGANTYDVTIYNNVAGLPGAVIFTQTGLTSTVGLNTIAVSPAAAVTDTFFVAFTQVGAALLMGYQTESPLRTNAFFLKSGVNPWFDLAGNSANTFRLMVGVTTGAALPVTLLNFTGVRENQVNRLNWTTATETNSNGFEVLRSADGVNFSSIGFVTSKAEGGNSTSTLNYSFTDARTLSGTNYYRLQQIDLDGKTSYSSIVALKGDKAGLTISAAYPNPTRENVRIIVSSSVSEKANISVTDINGKIVHQMSNVLVAGDNNININVASLSAGTYYVRLVTGSEVKTTQFIKQ